MKAAFALDTLTCPNCGGKYEEGIPDEQGWRTVSIRWGALYHDDLAGNVFNGYEFYCAGCRHTWRIAKPD